MDPSNSHHASGQDDFSFPSLDDLLRAQLFQLREEPSEAEMSSEHLTQSLDLIVGVSPTYTTNIGLLFQDLTQATIPDTDPLIIGIFENETEAGAAMLQHASNEISRHLEWGATHERVGSESGTMEIVGADREVKLRYGIEQVVIWSTGAIERMHDPQGVDEGDEYNQSAALDDGNAPTLSLPAVQNSNPLSPQLAPYDDRMAISQHVTMYGVYCFRSFANPSDQLLVYVTDSEEHAYYEMQAHAIGEISKHVEWGATHESEGYRNLEIIGADGTMKLKYKIYEVVDLGDGTFQKLDSSIQDEAVETQQPMARENDDHPSPSMSDRSSSRPSKTHYPLVMAETDASEDEEDTGSQTEDANDSTRFGLYVLPNPAHIAKGHVCYIENYGSIGEAESDMKMIAGGQLEHLNKNGKDVHCRSHEDGHIDIVDKNDRPTMRYVIYEGSVVNGKFINDDLDIHPSDRYAVMNSVASAAKPAPKRTTRVKEVQQAASKAVTGKQVSVTSRKRKSGVDASKPAATEEFFCRCHLPNDGRKYIECSGKNCPNRNWLHLECAELKSAPKTKNWLCPECRNMAKLAGRAPPVGRKSAGAGGASARKQKRR